MERNDNPIIVFSLADLKRVLSNFTDKKIGYWAFHANFHEGHRKIAEACQHCDIVVGALFNNWADGERYLLGQTLLNTYPLYQRDLCFLQQYSDICLILTGDYNPFIGYEKQIKQEFEESFPIECLIEKQVLDDPLTFNALYYSVAYRYILHGIYEIYFDYQAQSGKDKFRMVGYIEYLKDRWGVTIDILDPVVDEHGNALSKTISGLPQSLKKRIYKKLVLKNFQNIQDVIEHVKDIEGLKVLNFYRSLDWIHVTFCFDGYKPWVEGVRIN